MAGAADKRAGGAYVEIYANSAALVRGLKKAEKQLIQFGGKVRNIGAGMFAAGAGIAAPLALAVKEFSRYGDDVAKMARRTGLAVETVSALSIQAELTGANITAMEKATRAMGRGIFDAKRGAGEMKDAMKEMGLTFEDLDGLSPDEQFWKLAKAIASVKDPSIRAALAQKAFGRAGTELIPLMEAGADAMEETSRRAKELGLILDKEASASAEVLTDQLTWLKKALTGIQLTLGGALARDISVFTEALVQGAKAVVTLIKENKEFVRTVAGFAAGLLAVGTTLITVGTGIQLLGFAIGGITKVLGTIAALFSPIVLASIAAGAGLFLFADAALSAFGLVNTGFSDLIQNFRVKGLTIGTWLTLGVLEAMKIYEELRTGIIDVFDDIVTGAKITGSMIASGLLEGISTLASGMDMALKGITSGLADMARTVLTVAERLKLISGGEAKVIRFGIEAVESGISGALSGVSKAAQEGIDSALAEMGEATEGAIMSRIERGIARSEELEKRLEALKETGRREIYEDTDKEDVFGGLVNDAKKQLEDMRNKAQDFGDYINSEINKALGIAGDKQAGDDDESRNIAKPSEVFGSFSARAVSGQVADKSIKELTKANTSLSQIATSTKKMADNVGLA